MAAKAIDGALNIRRVLKRYLDDGNVALDNNAAENAKRPFVPARHKPACISLSGPALGVRRLRMWQHRAFAK